MIGERRRDCQRSGPFPEMSKCLTGVNQLNENVTPKVLLVSRKFPVFSNTCLGSLPMAHTLLNTAATIGSARVIEGGSIHLQVGRPIWVFLTRGTFSCICPSVTALLDPNGRRRTLLRRQGLKSPGDPLTLFCHTQEKHLETNGLVRKWRMGPIPVPRYDVHSC